MEQEHVQFKDALVALQKGKRITKASWEEPEMFVFKQVPSEINMSTVPRMQSIPDSVKREFERRLVKNEGISLYSSIRYEDQFCLVASDNLIYSFVPSTSDVLSNDWIVLDKDLGPQDMRREDRADKNISGNHSFAEALEALKEGAKIFRRSWKEKSTYLYYVPSSEYPSITLAAKTEFGDTTPYREYIGMKTAENDVLVWTPSSSDVLENDWRIYTGIV